MIDWFSFTPQDTLYFRGAEPANMGESHAASMIFPPPGHTIAGALRTAVLVQNDIAFTDYNEGVLPPDKKSITEMIGDSGADCPFQVIGPLFSLEERVWVPCPFIWFSEKKDGGNQCGMMSSLRLRLCAVYVFAKLGLIRIGLSNECGRKD